VREDFVEAWAETLAKAADGWTIFTIAAYYDRVTLIKNPIVCDYCELVSVEGKSCNKSC